MRVKQGEAAARPPSASGEGHDTIRSSAYWLLLAGTAGAYVATAKFGIALSVAHGVITPVWAPSGIALAALLLFGRRLWPAVALGALIANGTSGAEPAVAAGIAVGNTLEALVGAHLLGRFGFRVRLERVRDVLLLVVFAAGLSTLVSATNGVTVLSLAGGGNGSYGSDWLLWWFGDAVGILMVAPLLLVAFSLERRLPSRARALEALALLGSLSAVAVGVFLAGAWRYPYLLFPLLLWAALRFRQPGAAASVFLVGAIGTWGTVAGTLPIAAGSPTERVQIIQALVGVLAISLLMLGATLAERERANRELSRTAARLGAAQALTQYLLAHERAQNARLHELDQLKDSFLASVSHEFRTPLTSLIGMMELLRDESAGTVSDEQERYLEICWRNTERLHRLVNDLLFLAQADAGHLRLELTRVDLRALASQCVESSRPWAEKAGVELALVGHELPALEGDPARLAQLLDNLVSNAIKFSTEGGGVEVRTHAGRKRAVLEVADRGIGIPRAQQQHLFESFFRGSNAAELAIRGTGLGLSIAKMIVDAHGGSMSFESTESEGTVFRIELPLAADAEDRARVEAA